MYFDNKNSIDFVLGTLHAFAIKCVSAYIYIYIKQLRCMLPTL